MATKNQKTDAAFEKKVRAAATELEKNGVRITNANIREKIGGGSFRDIGPLVKALLAEKSAREKAETEVPDMPEEEQGRGVSLRLIATEAEDDRAPRPPRSDIAHGGRSSDRIPNRGCGDRVRRSAGPICAPTRPERVTQVRPVRPRCRTRSRECRGR